MADGQPADDRAAAVALIDRLRAEYRQGLPDRLAELRAALAAARSDPAGLPEAHRVAHRLAGTAGSYGCHGFGEACGQIEDALAGALKGADPWARIDEAFKAAVEGANPAAVEASPVAGSR